MNLFDIITRADFDLAIEQKLITIRDDGAGLRILNYSDAAMYTTGAWSNPAVRTCRGVIVTDDWTVIARPWSKFFNHNQSEAGDLDLDAPVEVTDKADGSLGIIHRALDGTLRVATRGSFQSEQAEHATAVLHTNYPEPWLKIPDALTVLVEIVYPENRIVCDYGTFDDLILLGSVNIETGEYRGPAQTAAVIGWVGPITDTFTFFSLRDALAAAPRPGAEGLCVRYLDAPRIVKIKQEDYVRLHRIVTGLSERSVWEHMCQGDPLGDLLGTLPDELHPWTREVWGRIQHAADCIQLDATTAHARILTHLPDGCSRRDYAELAKAEAPLTPLLFHLLDGRDPRPSILRNLKPAGDTRAKTITEAVA
jgi:RNA ligase